MQISFKINRNCVVKCFKAINLRACRAPNWWRRAQNVGPLRAFSNYGPPRLRQNCKIWPVRNPGIRSPLDYLLFAISLLN